MTTYPEHVSGGRAADGGRQRDHAVCVWEGHEYRVVATSATTELARALVAAGCPEQAWEAYTLEGERSLYGRSLHGWAGRVVRERDRGFKTEAWREPLNAGAENGVQTASGVLAGG